MQKNVQTKTQNAPSPYIKFTDRFACHALKRQLCSHPFVVWIMSIWLWLVFQLHIAHTIMKFFFILFFIFRVNVKFQWNCATWSQLKSHTSIRNIQSNRVLSGNSYPFSLYFECKTVILFNSIPFFFRIIIFFSTV